MNRAVWPAHPGVDGLVGSGDERFCRQRPDLAAFLEWMGKKTAANWKQWMAENGHRMLLFARGWANAQADAEDLVQEAVMRLWKVQQEKGGVPPDLPLAFSTIRFCGLNRYRSDTRRKKREESIVYMNDFEDVWLDASLEEDEEALLLRQAVEDLSPKLREVVTMKIWGGLTFAQISESLAISPNTAASRYRYALEQLSQSMRQVKEVRDGNA